MEIRALIVIILFVLDCSIKCTDETDDSLRQEDIVRDIQSILGNDTLLESLLQRYPDFYSVVTQVVNQTTLHNSTKAIDEGDICNMTRVIIKKSEDTCVTRPLEVIHDCLEEPNTTKVAKELSPDLCESTFRAANSISIAPGMLKGLKRTKRSTKVASLTLNTSQPAQPTKLETTTSDKGVTKRKEETKVPAGTTLASSMITTTAPGHPTKQETTTSDKRTTKQKQETTVSAGKTLASLPVTTTAPGHSAKPETTTSDKGTTRQKQKSTVPTRSISALLSQNGSKSQRSTTPVPTPKNASTTMVPINVTNVLLPTTSGTPRTFFPIIGLPDEEDQSDEDNAPDVVTGYLFLAIRLAVKTAMVSFEKKCNMRGGTYVKERRVCLMSFSYENGMNTTGNHTTRNHTTRNYTTRNYTIWHKENMTNSKRLRIIHITGNSASILATFLLVIECYICKKQFSLFDKCVLSLAICLLISHVIQLLITFLGRVEEFCKASGILLHWALLASFIWMSVISFDVFKAFRKSRRADSRPKNQYRKYLIFATSSSTTVVLICVLLGIPEENFSGYGYRGRCFIGKAWANMFSFTLPAAILLLANTSLMIATLLSIHKAQRRGTRKLSMSGSQTTSSRKKVVLSLLTLKLSVLFGLGWSIGFLDNFIITPVLPYIFTGIVSMQGLLVFICFGYHKMLLKKCGRKSRSNVERPILQSTTKRETETETTNI